MSYGATGNGVTDDTAAINAAKTAAGVGGSIYFPATYTYKMSSDLNPLQGQTVNASGARLLGTIGIYQSSVTICGAEVGPVPGYGVYFNGVSFTHLTNLNVHDTGNIAIFGEIGVTDSLIENSTVTRSGFSGITIHAQASSSRPGARNRILNNTVSTSAQINIEIWSPTSTVTGNTTYDGTMGLSIGGAPGSVVGFNHVHHASGYGIELGNGSGSSVHDNTVDATWGGGDGGDGIIIDDGEHNSSILRNLVTNSAQRGIQFSLGSYSNTADSSTETGYGICGVETHTVDNNVITNNTGSVVSF